MDVDSPDAAAAEAARLRDWRWFVLHELGFDGATLDLLTDSGCDIHTAEKLIRDGCDASLAAHILL